MEKEFYVLWGQLQMDNEAVVLGTYFTFDRAYDAGRDQRDLNHCCVWVKRVRGDERAVLWKSVSQR